MYGQGNYGSQFGQGPHAAMPPFQQRPPGPPPPPPPFQQGPPALPHSIMQQVSSVVPPQVGHQPGPPVYQCAPPPPHAPAQHGPPVQAGMLNAGQSYLHPPPPAHGSAPYPTAQQSSHYPPHLGPQNVHHIPQPVPPPPLGPPRPEMLQAPPPPRVLPPPPSQGQTLYRTSVQLPPPPGGVQGLQHIPPPPPPPTSSYFTPAPYGSFVHSAHGDSHMPSMAPPPPPPLPSSPPPLPPSPPSSTSPPPGSRTLFSTPLLAASELPSGTGSHKISSAEVMVSDSVDKVSAAIHIRDNMSMRDDHINHEGGANSDVGSFVKDGSSSKESGLLNLPSPPTKPTEEKIVQNIEILCQFIARNGPGFEDMARKKECGNPEFVFLIGGEPGSEAAIAHEYFMWMKNKCILEFKLRKGNELSGSPSRPLEVESSMQADRLTDAGAPTSPADSDMDMEDDIIQFDKDQGDQGVYHSFEGPNLDCVVVHNKLDVKEQVHTPQSSAVCSLAKDALPKNVSCSGSPGLDEQGKGPELFPDHDHSTFGISFSKVHSSVMSTDGAAECPLDSTVEKPITSLLDNFRPSRPSTASGKFSSQSIKGGSPFRLLQDYASDDSSENDDEPNLEDVSPVRVASSVTAGTTGLKRDMGHNLETDVGSKRLCWTGKEIGPLSEPVVASHTGMPFKVSDFSSESQMDVKETVIRSIVTGKIDGQVDNKGRIPESTDHAAAHEAFQQKNALGGGGVDIVPESGKSQKEDAKCAANSLKVDEFGRLVREGASDSDSGHSHYTRRRGKRGRSWSRSPSPHDRRRRRSPWRRKEKRSRSRSWSPKKRRSRSKSPVFRRVGEFGGERMRRDKGQTPDCLDFLRGRCQRGASCRFLHRDSDKSDGSRRHKSKQHYPEVPPSSKISDIHEEIKDIPVKISGHEHVEVKSQEMHLGQDLPGSSFGARGNKNINDERKYNSGRDAVKSIVSDLDGQLVTDVVKSESFREAATQVQETLEVQKEPEEPTTHLSDEENCQEPVETHQPSLVDSFSSQPVTDAETPKSPDSTSQGVVSSVLNLGVQQPQNNLSTSGLQNADHHLRQMDGFSISNSSPEQTPAAFPNQLPVSQPFSSDNISSQLPLPPPPPPPPLSQGVKGPHVPQPPRDYNLMQHTASFPLQSATGESISSYQAPLPNQHPHFSVPPSSSWTSLPPPPPPPPPYNNDLTINVATATPGFPSQFQQNQLPARNDFASQSLMRPYPTDLPPHSQVADFQHRAYLPMQELHRPPLHMEDGRSKPLAVGSQLSLPFGGANLIKEDRFTQFPVQGLIPSSSFAQGNMHAQPIPFSRESPVNKMQSFPGDNLPPSELYKSSSQNHPYSQQQLPPNGLQRPAADSISAHSGLPGKINSSTSRIPSDILDRNQLSHLPDFGGSRISTYYNPYASTFDQPLSSKFSSTAFRQEKDAPYGYKYDTPFSLSHLPVDGHRVGSLGSRQMSSPNSARSIGQVFPRMGGDQYDPLFDSIEPSSNPFGKFDVRKQELTNDSDIMLRLSASRKPLDVEENNKKKEVGAIAVTTSLENDEYGETADAEVGAVENESPSNPIDVENTAAGEIEIDQIKSPGKSKKSKDSRSMKLFKISLADFVKEVLKPSWRQGNMSKEAFKTIVKKTVDKVSGAMKGHQVPKSQAKINQYIDSSQRKLTKLVMGYVDKYVKV
ncbi:hypothetical protein L1049_025289 [Liquidambar formosana]|uniref:C3H1-type domain-containing protein n=1 Tax=Liquidambar formosana TaxID=63359 RepID=A0AAP0N8D9_LIQFO